MRVLPLARTRPDSLVKAMPLGPHHLKPWIVAVRTQGQVNPDVVATKMRFDPLGLLKKNLSKLRGWDLHEQIMADVAAGKVALATLLRF